MMPISNIKKLSRKTHRDLVVVFLAIIAAIVVPMMVTNYFASAIPQKAEAKPSIQYVGEKESSEKEIAENFSASVTEKKPDAPFMVISSDPKNGVTSIDINTPNMPFSIFPITVDDLTTISMVLFFGFMGISFAWRFGAMAAQVLVTACLSVISLVSTSFFNLLDSAFHRLPSSCKDESCKSNHPCSGKAVSIKSSD